MSRGAGQPAGDTSSQSVAGTAAPYTGTAPADQAGPVPLGAAERLGTPTNFAATAGQSVVRSGDNQARRRDRYRLRDVLNEVSSLGRCRRCGWRLVGGANGVPIVLADLVAHFGNLQLCGSVWACPVCGPRVRESRAQEVEAGLAVHLGRGGGAGFLTTTLPHDQGDALEPLFNTVIEGFRSNLGSRGWLQDRREFGIVGMIRSPEITHGANGWHPHLHAVLLSKAPLAPSSWDTIADGVYVRWAGVVGRAGYRTPTRERGVTLSAVRSAHDIAQYTAKYEDAGSDRSVGRELTRHDMKAARRAGRTPIEILRDFEATGDTSDLALWHEYERVTKGKSSLRWSRGLKRDLGIGDVSDSDIVNETIAGEILDVLSRTEFRYVKSHRLAALLLEAAEHPDRERLRDLMRRLRSETR